MIALLVIGVIMALCLVVFGVCWSCREPQTYVPEAPNNSEVTNC